MNKNNKILLSIIAIFIIISLANLFLFFGNKNSKKQSAINNLKTFIIEAPNADKNDFSSLNTPNKLQDLSNYNQYVPNFSTLIFDISLSNNQELINDLAEISHNFRLGIIEFNTQILENLKNNFAGTWIKINFDLNATNKFEDIQLSNQMQKISINPNYLKEENEEIFIAMKRLHKNYNVNFYLNEDDLGILNTDNSELIDMIIDIKPLLISKNQNCSLQENICFFNNKQNPTQIGSEIKNLMQEIFEKKIKNKKLILAIQYSPELLKSLEQIQKITDTGFIKIEK